ncbi:hypothetical protein FRC07_007156 [Ceratobasidium sp. 392]|nr:hypothetical protein FRC07_007156 [Ceratobasidium sp. 392]
MSRPAKEEEDEARSRSCVKNGRRVRRDRKYEDVKARRRKPLSSGRTVLELKRAIAENGDVPADRQILLFSGHILQDGDSLAACQVQNANTIYMVPGASPSTSLQLLPVMQTGGTNPTEAGMMFHIVPNPSFFPSVLAQSSQPSAMDPQIRATLHSEQLQTISSSLDALRDMIQMAAGAAQAGIDRSNLRERFSASSLGAFALLGNITGMSTAGAGSTGTGTQNGTAGGAPPPTSGEPGAGTNVETGSESAGYAVEIAEFGIAGAGIGIAGTSSAAAGGHVALPAVVAGAEPTPSPAPASEAGVGGAVTSAGGAGAGGAGTGGVGTATGGAWRWFPQTYGPPHRTGRLPGTAQGSQPGFHPTDPCGVYHLQGQAAGSESDAVSSLAPSDYKQLVEAAFHQLQDLGFANAQQNVRALLANGGQVDPPIDYMLRGAGKAKVLDSGTA